MYTSEETAKKMREVLALIERSLPTAASRDEPDFALQAFFETDENFGITTEEECRLYARNRWPEAARKLYPTLGMCGRFDVLRDRVEHFIETGE